MDTDSYKEFEVLFRNAMSRQIGTNGYIFGFIGLCMLVFVSAGFFIGAIIAGFYLALIIIAPVYDPAYQLVCKLLRLQNLPSRIVKPPLSKFVSASLSLIAPGLFIFYGIRGLSSFGFCWQSALCVLVDSFR